MTRANNAGTFIAAQCDAHGMLPRKAWSQARRPTTYTYVQLGPNKEKRDQWRGNSRALIRVRRQTPTT